MVNPKNIGDVKNFSETDLRFATPVEVASYRARRLKCKVIVDLCSGIGIQSAAFAKTCDQVYGFELDSRKVEYAQKNFEGVKNVHFETGDVLDPLVIEKVKQISPDIIFCDPERLPSEKERNLDSIKPDVVKLLEVYSKITPNICLEVPPQIDIEKLNVLGNCEKEYLSFNCKLNRLDLCFGNLKKADISVVDVSGERIEGKSNKFEGKFANSSKVMKYLYEVSTAVTKSGLTLEFAKEIGGFVLEGCEKNRVLLTCDKLSNKLISLCKAYEVIGTGNNYIQVIDILKRARIGKVVIKYSVDPKDYWKERNRYENSLRGNSQAVLFLVNQKYLICEEI